MSIKAIVSVIACSSLVVIGYFILPKINYHYIRIRYYLRYGKSMNIRAIDVWASLADSTPQSRRSKCFWYTLSLVLFPVVFTVSLTQYFIANDGDNA